MKIGIISDTHDDLRGIQKAIHLLKQHKAELIIHCGDWVSPFAVGYIAHEAKKAGLKVKGVLGNNIGDLQTIMERNVKSESPVEFAHQSTMELDLKGKKAVVYHGHDKQLLEDLIASKNYDAVFCGHTHKPKIETIGKTLVVNPGNTCFAVEGQITDTASVALYDTNANTAEIITFSFSSLLQYSV